MDLDAAGERPEYDPSYASVQGVFTAVFNEYIRRDLKYETDLPYEVLTGKVQPWDYKRFENRYVNVAEMLREAMTQNPNLKVMIVNGYYDMATPFFATEYTVSHLGLQPELASHVSLKYCDAGHMLYVNEPVASGVEEGPGRLHPLRAAPEMTSRQAVSRLYETSGGASAASALEMTLRHC